jgi:hypothetical protein
VLLVRAHQFGLGDHVALQGGQQGGAAGVVEVGQEGVEGVEAVEVAVAADRGTGAAVVGAVPVVLADQGSRR